MTDGVYGAFDYNADLVRALAIIGSSTMFYTDADVVKSEFKKQGLDYGRNRKAAHYSQSLNLFELIEFGSCLRSN
jgi:hypothetical protein